MKVSFFIFIILLSLVSCQNHENDQKPKNRLSNKVIKDKLVKTNQFLVKAEEQNIIDYIARHQYKMTETGSGLFYEIYKKGRGVQAEKGKVAVLNFSISLLNGKTIYRSEEKGVKEFLIGKGRVESGLEEGILLLHVGDRARIIIPSHLAFGLLGDLNKIPEKATIIYDLELVNLK
ncbi:MULTISPECIES: FKBP-type peptidyl-prolyl cis-trans isomerase [unclassified Lentimicrobium]|uniref:FKBP-type peptidyl-prolyl cis-trans isomerase n=1 Tax=unclassified Lentimicrobium TaxID=2677434 RepID=UPI0015547EF0|nr:MULTISPECIES: FKBP-type peptidyl-prolyl cis-trans isomerase [unclassified Lentimicrobium]NPD45428.1 peptidylprolyl isomerase [Lentimicrobium sp. S6]NPD83790.1 peptidylprolyl isomerase [Lentimicrobium sp. L6]